MQFPERIYTEKEHQIAKDQIDKGYKHRLAVEGSLEFRQKVYCALELIKITDYYPCLAGIATFTVIQVIMMMQEAIQNILVIL